MKSDGMVQLVINGSAVKMTIGEAESIYHELHEKLKKSDYENEIKMHTHNRTSEKTIVTDC